MTRTPILLALALAGTAAPAQAQVWRTDYNAARREAAESGKPIFIDFVTDNCLWCKKLEATTFADRTIAATLRDQFVLLKVDGEREPTLAQALRVNTYPTMVMAGPDGKILGTIEGYMEAGRLQEHLARVLATATTADWMARDFQEATKSIGTGDYARAVALLKGIAEDGKERPIQVKARQVIGDIDQQAAGRLAKAKQLEDRGQGLEAIETITDLLKSYAGTPTAGQAAVMLSRLAAKPEIRDWQRNGRAKELLAEARDDFKAQRFGPCLERCETIASTFGELPEATEAKQLAAEIRANPERLARACDQMQERLAAMYLTQAEAWLAKGDSKQAQSCLEKLAQSCPATPQAHTAIVKLNELRGSGTITTNFKK